MSEPELCMIQSSRNDLIWKIPCRDLKAAIAKFPVIEVDEKKEKEDVDANAS